MLICAGTCVYVCVWVRCLCVCVCDCSKIVSRDKILCSINTALVITWKHPPKSVLLLGSVVPNFNFFMRHSLDSGISKDSSPCFLWDFKGFRPCFCGLEMILAPVLLGFQRIPDPVSVGLEMIPNLVLIPNPFFMGFQKIPDPDQNQIHCPSTGL